MASNHDAEVPGPGAASAVSTPRGTPTQADGTTMPGREDTIALPGFVLDAGQAVLRDATGAEVRLRPQAFDVLHLLARNAGRVVTKDELMRTVWAGTVVTDDSLVQCIKEIRQALRDPDHTLVRTSPKRGYWLVLPNAEGRIPNSNGATGAIGADGANGASGPLDGTNGTHGHFAAEGGHGADVHAADGARAAVDRHVPAPAVNSAPVTHDPSRRRFGLGTAALAVGGLGGASGLAWWLSRPPITSIQAKAEQPSIVVLPIRNISGGERWDRLARGLTEDITTDLARNHWLFIIASSAAFQRAASGKDALAIARELGVRFALEGSLQAEGDAVRVNARLLESATGGTVWSQRWDKPQGQLFDIQDSIVGAIDNSLGSAWTGVIATTDRANARRRPTSNLAAYELFLIGSEHKHRFTPDDLAKARDYLDRSVQLDPGFAKAWAALAIVHAIREGFAPDDQSRQAEVAARRRAITQAHQADPDDPNTLIQFSWILATNGDTGGAQKALRRAVAIASNNADALVVAALDGAARCPLGDEPLQWVSHALRLNPNPPSWYYLGLGVSALYSRQYKLAVDAFQKAPDYPFRWYSAAAAHALNGDLGEARSAIKRLLELNPGARAGQFIADRGNWGNPEARDLFLKGARLAGLPE